MVEPGQTDEIASSPAAERANVVHPVVPLLDTVLFPRMVVPLSASRPKSVKAIEHAAAEDRQIVFIAQRQPSEEDGGSENLFAVGTLANIGQVLQMPDGTLHVLVQGVSRVRLLDIVQQEPFLEAHVETVEEINVKTVEVQGLMASVVAALDVYAKLGKSLPVEVVTAAKTIEEPGWLADVVAFSPDLTFEQREQLLETLDPVARLQQVLVFLQRQNEILEIRNKIQSDVQQGVDKHQREFFLREQLKAIQKELGESNPEVAVTEELDQKIQNSLMPAEVKTKALKELERMKSMPAGTPETGVIRTFLEWLVELPWGHSTPDQLDVAEAARILDEDHYGLARVKERLLEYIAVRKLAQDRTRGQILCFVGPPGVGKTSLGRSIARALGRKFVRMSLGGIRDEAEIRGHRRTYIGSMPGRIVKGIRDAGSNNPVFMLDEIDKVGTDFRGDPSSALLEVLDPEQNFAFSDHYLEVPFDLSKVIFIATANLLDTVPPALRDRMEVIEIPGYTEEEKLAIAQQFLLPKQLEQHGLSADNLAVEGPALLEIIRVYTKEAGVRNLEREIASLCRKMAKRIAEGREQTTRIGLDDVEEYLGVPKFTFGMAEEADEIGVATGLAWTELGGDVLSVEVSLMEGKGELILTGQLGKVMQESAQAAVSYARARSRDFHLPGEFFDKHTIHIHVPAGAIPKDGPSAGITMATALVSALTARPVRREVAMTGEITLRGRVLPIGGLKEKILAAHRAGITTVLLPEKNSKDLVDVPAHVRDVINMVAVSHIDEVLEAALLPRLQTTVQRAA